VPNSPEVVQIKSPSIATICLDEPFQPTIVTDIVNNCDDFNNIVKSTEVKAQSSTSAKRINEDDTCISLFATDEYVPALKADETREEVIYEPTPKHILQLKTMAECQKSRIILNVGTILLKSSRLFTMSVTIVAWNGSSKQIVAILGDLICTTSGEFGTEFIGEIIFGIHVGGVKVGTYR
jgi:hypothetical protein